MNPTKPKRAARIFTLLLPLFVLLITACALAVLRSQPRSNAAPLLQEQEATLTNVPLKPARRAALPNSAGEVSPLAVDIALLRSVDPECLSLSDVYESPNEIKR